MHVTRRLALVVATFALTAVCAAAPAGAADLAVQVDPSTVQPGQEITISGPADCIQGTTLTININGLGIPDQTVPGDTAWQLKITIPTNAKLGPYTVRVFDSECTYADGTFLVEAAATTTTSSTTTSTTAAPTTTSTIPAVKAQAVATTPSFTG